MNRREFLTGFTRKQETKNTPAAPRTVETPGSPKQYSPGDAVLVTSVGAWLIRDKMGFYALDALCPHFGGALEFNGKEVVCPEHGSRFDSQGCLAQGPAPCELQAFAVELDKNGNLVIRRDQFAAPGERLIA